MARSQAESEQAYDQFIETVATSFLVWGLQSESDVPMLEPLEVDDTGQPKGSGVIPYWSDQEAAEQCRINGWERYETTEIPLDWFLETLVPKLVEDGIVLGINFDTQLMGREVDAEELVTDLLARLKETAESSEEEDEE